MNSKQIVFTEAYKAELLTVECPPPSAGEVTVTLDYSAISAGTEKANFIGERNAPDQSEASAPTFPRTVGYSGVGRVSALGAGVTEFALGDRVAFYWGKHQKQKNYDCKQLIKLPEGVSDEEAAFAFIATFPLAAIRKTHLEIGESALVMGLGVLGILAVSELKAAGACPIIAADPKPERRALALEMGADHALNPLDPDFAEQLKCLTLGGVNVCIEVTGLGAGLIGALDCMKSMGRVALLGCTRSSKFEIDYYGKVHGRGISLIGAHTCARPDHESAPSLWTHKADMQAILCLLAGGRLNFRPMIAERHSPADCQKLYSRLAEGKDFPVGVLFDWRRI